jgi:phospholipid/cholesterol/gamma-HCH transport system substrate-binding protein
MMAGALGCTAARPMTLYAVFEDVGDLVTLSNVQQSDAVIGRVTKLELDGWNARVTMQLNDGVVLPQGTRAVVRSTSLLGEKFVDLEPPAGGPPGAARLRDGDTIGVTRTSKAPELEEVFSELGGILASGALSDLGALTTAAARIVEGQELQIGRVLDGTQLLVASLAAQRDALAEALDRLGSSASTLAGGTDTVNRFLQTSDQALSTLAAQRSQLEQLVVNLAHLGRPQAQFFDEYKDEVDRQLKALVAVIDKLHEARPQLDSALARLPQFARLFADAAPGDYVQLDVFIEGFPDLGGGSGAGSASSVLWSAALGPPGGAP